MIIEFIQFIVKKSMGNYLSAFSENQLFYNVNRFHEY